MENDNSHCGDCFIQVRSGKSCKLTQCGTGSNCVQGQCENNSGCGPGQMRCGNEGCIKTSNDNRHCGQCWTTVGGEPSAMRRRGGKDLVLGTRRGLSQNQTSESIADSIVSRWSELCEWWLQLIVSIVVRNSLGERTGGPMSLHILRLPSESSRSSFRSLAVRVTSVAEITISCIWPSTLASLRTGKDRSLAQCRRRERIKVSEYLYKVCPGDRQVAAIGPRSEVVVVLLNDTANERSLQHRHLKRCVWI